MIADNQGNIQKQYDYAPYGELHWQTGTDPNHYQFAGKELDTESGDSYFGARFYRSNFGRFITPDWSATPSAIPYALFPNPQTLNLYSYNGNQPLTKADIDGHCYPWCTVAAGVVIGGIIGGGAEYLNEKLHNQPADRAKIWHAVVGGAIAGGITGLAGPEAGLTAKVGIATLGSVEGGRVQRALNGEKINSPKAIAIDAATGAAGGVVMHGVDKIVPAASAGMNGSQATGYIFRTQENAAAENTVRNVGKQILTNAANGGLSVENSNLQNQASQQQTQQQQKDDQTLDQIESNPVGLSPEHISHNVNPK